MEVEDAKRLLAGAHLNIEALKIGFTSLAQARCVISTWRQDYNEVCPHSSCGRIPPARFAANHRSKNTTTALPFNLGLCQ